MNGVTRRGFLRGSLAASAVYSPLAIARRAADPYRTVLIGSGWWGTNIARVAVRSGKCRLTGICDVDRSQAAGCLAEMQKLGGQPRVYTDYRELLAVEKPQVAIVATPDHWHALPMIAAVQAGAHVYVEKPIGHTVNEGRAMVAAARKTGRVVQVGLHRRVSPHNRSAMQFLREGKLGQVGMVRAFAHYPGGAGRPLPDSDPPEGLDWDFYCGPAPLRPFNRAIHPRGFRQFLDFANGQLGDWGVHWIDQVLMWSEEKWPTRVHSTMARHIRRDHTDAPDTQVATFEFEGFTLVWEHRQYAGNEAERTNVGCYFYGTAGTLHLGWLDGWTFYPSRRGQPVVHEDARLHEPDQQNIPELWTDFMEAIEGNRAPVCDIEIGHRSSALPLLGMVSASVGRSLRWDGARGAVAGDAEANRHLSRKYRAPWVYPRT